MKIYFIYERKVLKNSFKIIFVQKSFITVIKFSNENENIEKKKKSAKNSFFLNKEL